jgi:carboxyl-terminal processing protease
MKTDEELKEYATDIAELKQRRANKIVSLNETVRKAERDELEKKRLAKQKKATVKTKPELPETPDEDQPQSSADAVLNESARIVADIISVS